MTYKGKGTKLVDHEVDQIPTWLDITKEFYKQYLSFITSIPLVSIAIDNSVTKAFATLVRHMDNVNNIVAEGDRICCESLKVFIFVNDILEHTDPCSSNISEVGSGVTLDNVSYAYIDHVWEARNTVIKGGEWNFMCLKEFCEFTHGNKVVGSIVHGEMTDLEYFKWRYNAWHKVEVVYL